MIMLEYLLFYTQQTAFWICVCICFLSNVWLNIFPYCKTDFLFLTKFSVEHTVLTLMHSSLHFPLWFAFKEKEFVFWFLHQVSNSIHFLLPFLPFGSLLWLSFFTLSTYCNLTSHSVLTFCAFGLVWLLDLAVCEDLPNNLNCKCWHSGMLTESCMKKWQTCLY